MTTATACDWCGDPDPMTDEDGTAYPVESFPAGPYHRPCHDTAKERDPHMPDHDCPKDAFLDDPITRAYGVGGEMVDLIKCPICDAREEG